jgi:hypothetical protein
LDLGNHHAIELLLDRVRCFLSVLLIKNEPRLHSHFLLLEELLMVLTILFKELRDICIQMKLDPSIPPGPTLQLLNFKSEKKSL